MDTVETMLVQNMLSMHRIMMIESRLHDFCLADNLCTFLETLSDQPAWRSWVRTSPFLMRILRKLPEIVCCMCERFPPLLLPLAQLLGDRISEWTRDDMVKSYILNTPLALQLLAHEPSIDAIYCEMDRVQDVADTMARLLSSEMEPSSKKDKGEKSRGLPSGKGDAYVR